MAACVMVLLVSGVVSSSEKSVPPRDVIERMIRAMEELPGSYVETLVRIFPGRVETSVQRVWSKPPLFRRVELAAPGGEGRTVVVENRGVIWVRVPGFDRVLMWKPAPGEEPVFPSGLGSEGLTQGHPPARGEASGVSGGLEGLQLPPGSMLQQLVGALGGRLSSAARVSSGELSGRPVYLVEIKPGKQLVRVFVDRETYFVWREEYYDRTGKLIKLAVRSEVDLNPGIPGERFVFQVPPSARIVTDPREWKAALAIHSAEKAADFRLVLPEYLPEGFVLLGADSFSMGGVQMVVFRFGDGRRLISLFQAKDPAGEFAPKKPATRPRRIRFADGVTAYEAVVNGVRLVLVSELPEEQAFRVLDSFK